MTVLNSKITFKMRWIELWNGLGFPCLTSTLVSLSQHAFGFTVLVGNYD